MLWIVLVLLTHLQRGIYSYFDFELYHNTTEEEYAMQHKKAQSKHITEEYSWKQSYDGVL